PHRAIAALIHSIGTVLGQSVCLCITLARYRTVVKSYTSQSPALPSGPHHICPSTDGIDDLIWWYRCNGLNAAVLENVQPTLSGSEPGAALRVDIYRAIVFETTIANRGISYERTIPN